jgi:membrane protease YdiL (CAAX protease family)
MPSSPPVPLPRTRAALTLFLALTFALSAVFWGLIITAGSLGAHGGAYVLALMWCPGVSALVTRLVFQRDLRGQGWGLGEPRWAALAYLLPLAYAAVAYGAVWLAGLGGVELARFRTPVAMFVVVGSLQSLLSATGEELGWRGFLVPALARRTSFGRTALLSGAIWATWHVPLILFADYNAGTPSWYAVPCFAAMVVALAVALAWLRLRSGSVWPAAILHASHNLFVQGFFDRVTVDTGPTRWLTTEFGAALVVTIGVTAWLFWRARDALPGGAPARRAPIASGAAPAPAGR